MTKIRKNNQHQNNPEQISGKIMLSQLKEEERKEKILLILDRYKKQIGSILFIVIICIISLTTYQIQQSNKNKKYSKLIQNATIEKGLNNIDGYKNLLKEIAYNDSAPIQIKSLSLLQIAAQEVSENNIQKAVNIYLQINQSKTVDPYLQELSGLLALKTMIDSSDQTFQAKIEEILPILQKNSNILKHFIIEQNAFFQLQIGHKKEAKKIFQSLSMNPEAPQYLRERATEFHKMIR